MPPKPNGFYMFMLAEQKRLRTQTKRAPGMREMPGICREAWKRLPVNEKAKFDALAKQEKAKLQNSGDGTWAKLDCHRQVIANRKDPEKEENKRRMQERHVLQNSWHGQDVRDIVLHILDFQVMYDDISEDQHLPLEVGMVSITLRSGIINFMHHFINPGEVPQGNRHLATSHSENSHKIPLEFKHSDSDFEGLTRFMTKFIKSDSQEIPPVFCLQVHRRLVENCLDFIYSKVYVNDMDKIRNIYCLEDLVSCLIANSGKVEKSVAESQIFDMLRQNRWDYNSSIRCFYHEELDCSFCSLSIVKRYSFAIFDMLSTLLEFDLTEKHMPDELEQSYIVAETFGFRNSRAYNNTDDDERRNRSYQPSKSSSHLNRNQHFHREKENAWQPPRVDPVKVSLHDDGDESEEEELVLQPKTTEYSLEKLRLPKSMAQVQTQVSQLKVEEERKPAAAAAAAPPPSYPNPSVGLRGAMNTAPARPMGRGLAPSKMAQMRPMGRAAPSPIMPPPGFSPRPRLPMAATGYMPDEEEFPALSRRGGLGRGRLPSQHQL